MTQLLQVAVATCIALVTASDRGDAGYSPSANSPQDTRTDSREIDNRLLRDLERRSAPVPPSSARQDSTQPPANRPRVQPIDPSAR